MGQKLSLVAALFGLPLIGLTYLVVSKQQSTITTLRLASKAVPYLTAATDLQEQLQQYARAAILKQNLAPLAAKVEKSLSAYASTVNNEALYADGGQLNKVQTAWKTLRSGAASMSPTEVVNQSFKIAASILIPGITKVSTDTGLELDTQPDSYFLQTYLVNYLPAIQLQMSEAQLVAIQNASGSSRRDNAAKVTALVDAMQSFIAETENRYASVASSNPALKATLDPNFQAMKKDSAVYLAALRAFASGLSVPNIDALAQKSVGSTGTFASSSLTSLDSILAQRNNDERRQQLLELLSVAALVVLAYALLVIIARAITLPLSQLAFAARRVARGDLETQVPVTTRDEVGTVSTAFNTAVSQLRENEVRNVQERQEAARLQSNVGEFLDVTMDIAEGDLTKRGKVTEDVLGNVVDSINLMTEELGQVLKGVQRASLSITGGSVDMLNTTTDIQAGAELTANEAQNVARQVQSVIVQIREMAQNAQASADSARQALQASQQGQQAVEGTLEGMQNIRREVQGVSRRIKGLGDRSLEIQDIVNTISQIASQTNLLALNAAIEAAGAGEAGSRFAIVADEVRKLADNSAQATARIASLIRSVQTEIQDVILSVEDGTREVEQGYRVAGTAGERLREIGQLTQQSAQLAESISSATQMQVQGMEQVGSAVQEIASIADRSSESVERGRQAAVQLQDLATQMNVGLARFRLPG
ncbi:methyl-accepting chemotaxis protein [Deinococcus rubellus]|uniref:methyl-accepting chemotaxis protein n=1 Tax=Deinococcus rubellus TaxID=1889240 RepID=UPI0031EC4756